MPLLDADSCVLVVIDAQLGSYAEGELSVEDSVAAGSALERAAWLVAVAVRLEIPIVVTEEDAQRNGRTSPLVTEHLPSDIEVHDKPAFAVCGCPTIMNAISAIRRRTAVLVGFETDVCVAQSAVGLHDAGWNCVVVEDATFSPGEMHARGLRRATAGGAELNHCKGVAYEWVETVERSRRVIDSDPVLSDPPFRL